MMELHLILHNMVNQTIKLHQYCTSNISHYTLAKMERFIVVNIAYGLARINHMFVIKYEFLIILLMAR